MTWTQPFDARTEPSTFAPPMNVSLPFFVTYTEPPSAMPTIWPSVNCVISRALVVT